METPKRLAELCENGLLEKTLITEPTPKYTYALNSDTEPIVRNAFWKSIDSTTNRFG